MLGFQSPALEIELAKAVRLTDIEAAENFRIRRLVRRRTRAAATTTTRGSSTSATRPTLPVASPIGSPRSSSG